MTRLPKLHFMLDEKTRVKSSELQAYAVIKGIRQCGKTSPTALVHLDALTLARR
jgi:predicted AAA+ superfamily ATPase